MLDISEERFQRVAQKLPTEKRKLLLYILPYLYLQGYWKYVTIHLRIFYNWWSEYEQDKPSNLSTSYSYWLTGIWPYYKNWAKRNEHWFTFLGMPNTGCYDKKTKKNNQFCGRSLFFLSYSPLIIAPLWGALSSSSYFFGHVHPLQLLHRRLSVIADDVVVAVLVLV